MFRCQKCNEVQGKYAKPNRVVTKTRIKKYKNGSIGHEIVTEINVCDKCFEKMNSTQKEGRK